MAEILIGLLDFLFGFFVFVLFLYSRNAHLKHILGYM
jgi:hypothetical protein